MLTVSTSNCRLPQIIHSCFFMASFWCLCVGGRGQCYPACDVQEHRVPCVIQCKLLHFCSGLRESVFLFLPPPWPIIWILGSVDTIFEVFQSIMWFLSCTVIGYGPFLDFTVCFLFCSSLVFLVGLFDTFFFYVPSFAFGMVTLFLQYMSFAKFAWHLVYNATCWHLVFRM